MLFLRLAHCNFFQEPRIRAAATVQVSNAQQRPQRRGIRVELQGLCTLADLWALLLTGLLVSILLTAPVSTASAKARFPLYRDIRPHVQFWEKIYSRYTSSQGILHDKDNPTIIYAVIDFVDWHLPGSARINRVRVQRVREHYRDILTDLGRGKKPLTPDEKKVAALFPRKRHSSYLQARDNMRLQIGQKDHFRQSVIRSGQYLPMVKKIFRQQGLPLELAYLPHVESSFNPYAHSKAGAVGLWQFTRSTGKKYLRIDYLIDERFDPWQSTRAAARFLKENYQALGSWPLALTAYNYGRAGMVRAVEKRKNYLNIFKYHKEGRFGFASRNFYCEFLAALRVARRLENQGIIKDRPQATMTIRLNGYTEAQALMHYFQVAEEDFSRLNPALQLPLFEGRKRIPPGYLLRLPATRRIRKKMKLLGNQLAHTHQIRDRIHRVRKGDTLSVLARRYHVSCRALIVANNLPPNGRIRVGQKLKIPPRQRSTASLVVLNTQAKARVH